jgi:predicted AAA+ superfamily ATPase
MFKKFNVTGKCLPDKHYMADVSAKMSEILKLIEEGEYFIINRPRQYGKTTTLDSLANALRKTGHYIVFNVSFEGVGNDAFKTEKTFSKSFVRLLDDYAAYQMPQLCSWLQDRSSKTKDLAELSSLISHLQKQMSEKMVILIDEVDQSSNNEVFIKFLAMLRNKFLKRDEIPTFHSVVLAGCMM